MREGMTSSEQAESDPVTQAASLLSTLLHCRKQAKELQHCQKQGGGCERETQAFTTCSVEHMPLVINHLIKIADKKCFDEVEAVRWCRTHRPGDDCEVEDMAAMRCASLHVLAAAHAPKS
jgi:hypothetical protein